jgi:hypothetical protein
VAKKPRKVKRDYGKVAKQSKRKKRTKLDKQQIIEMGRATSYHGIQMW